MKTSMARSRRQPVNESSGTKGNLFGISFGGGSSTTTQRKSRILPKLSQGDVKQVTTKKAKRKGVYTSGFLLAVFGFVLYAVIISSVKHRADVKFVKVTEPDPNDPTLPEAQNPDDPPLHDARNDLPSVDPLTRTNDVHKSENVSLTPGNTSVTLTGQPLQTNTVAPGEIAEKTNESLERQHTASVVPESNTTTTTTTTTAAATTTTITTTTQKAAETTAEAHVSKASLYETSRICYVSPRFERVCVFAPLCIDSGELVYLDSEVSCQRIRPKGVITPVTGEECHKFEKSNMREAELKNDPARRDHQWLKEKEDRGEVTWIEGDSALFYLGGQAMNIAHYAGRLLFITHLLRHAEVFGLKTLDHVLLLSGHGLSSHLTVPGNWHSGALAAVVHPKTIPTSSHDSLDSYTGAAAAGVQVINVNTNSFPAGKTTCFRNAAIPAFLKGRYFIPNFETPLQKSYPDVPDPDAVPGDALIFRRNLFASLKSSVDDGMRMKNKLVYLRRLRRRELSTDSEAAFESALKTTGAKLGLEVKTVVFDGMTFEEQVEAVKGTAIAIGIHGANLVNSIFMPPSSYLIEIFPFGFDHDMYRGGCGSGLQYQRYEIANGDEYPQLTLYPNRRECMNKNNLCKLHYRSDNKPLKLEASDIDSLMKLITEAKKAVAPFISA